MRISHTRPCGHGKVLPLPCAKQQAYLSLLTTINRKGVSQRWADMSPLCPRIAASDMISQIPNKNLRISTNNSFLHIRTKMSPSPTTFCCWQHTYFLYQNVNRTATSHQWRTEGVGWGVQHPYPNSGGPPKSCQTQPDCENC